MNLNKSQVEEVLDRLGIEPESGSTNPFGRYYKRNPHGTFHVPYPITLGKLKKLLDSHHPNYSKDVWDRIEDDFGNDP